VQPAVVIKARFRVQGEKMEGRKRWRGRERGGLKKREKDKTKPTKTMMTVSGERKDERAHAATAVTAAPPAFSSSTRRTLVSRRVREKKREGREREYFYLMSNTYVSERERPNPLVYQPTAKRRGEKEREEEEEEWKGERKESGERREHSKAPPHHKKRF
jgi:hypothetical protein